MSKRPAKRITVAELVCAGGLGYCCEWAFWSVYRERWQGDLIATRLGVTPRAVQLHRRRFKQGKLACEGCGNCLKDKLHLLP